MKYDPKEWRCSLCGLYRWSNDDTYKRKNGQMGHVNDGGDRCTDCLIAPPEYSVGMELLIRAWWNNGKTVRCSVIHKSQITDMIEVKPLEGNPHYRSVRISDVVTEKNNYRMEMEAIHNEGKIDR